MGGKAARITTDDLRAVVVEQDRSLEALIKKFDQVKAERDELKAGRAQTRSSPSAGDRPRRFAEMHRRHAVELAALDDRQIEEMNLHARARQMVLMDMPEEDRAEVWRCSLHEGQILAGRLDDERREVIRRQRRERRQLLEEGEG